MFFCPDPRNEGCSATCGCMAQLVPFQYNHFFTRIIPGIIIGNGTSKNTPAYDYHIGFHFIKLFIYQAMENVFTKLKHFMASITPSLMPSPESLMPPKGE